MTAAIAAGQSAQAAQTLLLTPEGTLKAGPEEVLRSPAVITSLVVIYVTILGIIAGITFYWHELEEAKKLHPDSVGYGKWYYSLIPRIAFSAAAAGGVLLLVFVGIVLVFIFPGPMWAETRRRDQRLSQENRIINSLTGTEIRELSSI